MKPTDLLYKCFVWQADNPNTVAMIVVKQVSEVGDGEWWIVSMDMITGRHFGSEYERFIDSVSLTKGQVAAIES